MYNSNDSTKWAQLLDDAVKTPGKMLSAYQAFWNYSSGNQLLAMLQLSERGIPLGPIASFNAWKEKGRFVKKGSKAISLCMPVTCKRKDESGTTTEGTDGKPAVFTRFVFRNNWFALDQTDGEPYTPPAEQWVCIFGNFGEGFSFTGPFDSAELALDYGTGNPGNWFVVEMERPAEI